jgi:geranylgeranylglycerol-phosphate geranylgeranyltransferase
VSITKSVQPGSLATDVIALSHLFNGIGSAAGVGIGYLVTAWYYASPINIGAFIGSVLATLCISNGGFIINDIIDLPIDRINRPDRPLAAGRVPVTLAWTMYILYTLIGVIVGLAINPTTGAIAVAIAAGLFLYSYTLKKRLLIGHVVVAASASLLFVFGGVAAGYFLPTLYTIPATFFAFIAREILKTVPDAEGDRANGVDNLTTRFGPQFSVRLSQIMFALCAISLPLLRLVWPLNTAFLIAVVVVVWPLTVFFVVQLSRPLDIDGGHIKTVLRFSKLLFLIVALTLLLGAL